MSEETQQWRSKDSMGDFTGPVKELETRVALKFQSRQRKQEDLEEWLPLRRERGS